MDENSDVVSVFILFHRQKASLWPSLTFQKYY